MGRSVCVEVLMECDKRSFANFQQLVGTVLPIPRKVVCSSRCENNQTEDDYMSERQLHTKSSYYYCTKDLLLNCETIDILQCGCFYYTGVGSSEAKQMLKHCAVGTYLIRDSSDPKYLYTISVKTKRGPTSIRICYEYGRFSLDADERSKSQMPKFTSVLQLIDYYVRCSEKKAEQCRFLDKNGKRDLPIVLVEPRRHSVPSLKHLTRTLINRSLPSTKSADLPENVDKLPLPNLLKSYINGYPYHH